MNEQNAWEIIFNAGKEANENVVLIMLVTIMANSFSSTNRTQFHHPWHN